MAITSSENDIFVQKNFQKLVRKYAHQHIVICGGKVFTGDNAVKKARKEFPNLIPLLLPVPGPENFSHLL